MCHEIQIENVFVWVMKKKCRSRVFAACSLKNGMIRKEAIKCAQITGKKITANRGLFSMVPRVGLEPTHLAAGDFESPASTNFATWAVDLAY